MTAPFPRDDAFEKVLAYGGPFHICERICTLPRDLVRARAAGVETLTVHRQQVSAFMLKHGRVYPRKKGWTMRYLRWLQEQQFSHPAHQEMLEAVRVSKEWVERWAPQSRSSFRNL
jgi:hypothetical protein